MTDHEVSVPSLREEAPPLGDFERRLRVAIADPGAFTPRGDNYQEPIHCWSARAVLIASANAPLDERMEAMGMEPVGLAHQTCALSCVHYGRADAPPGPDEGGGNE